MQILKYEKVDASFKPWNEEYFNVANSLIEFIQNERFKVIHIGSTSAKVSGKGIIDLSLLYEMDQLKEAVNYVKSLGFQDQTGKKLFPRERPRKDGMVIFNEKKYNIHIHLILNGSIEHRKQIKFREFMLENPWARKKYEESKLEILEKGIIEQEEYGKEKSVFVKSVIEELENIE
ncbi:GrpB family protein [Halarcobacter sp.]|uniref:GrpB family protein n=1 Tax=Halarcobacter sp. TaxID=2321133 RepID=UPI002AA6597E|nr:GrpB family protein [Halarcobacter sp.]